MMLWQHSRISRIEDDQMFRWIIWENDENIQMNWNGKYLIDNDIQDKEFSCVDLASVEADKDQKKNSIDRLSPTGHNHCIHHDHSYHGHHHFDDIDGEKWGRKWMNKLW